MWSCFKTTTWLFSEVRTTAGKSGINSQNTNAVIQVRGGGLVRRGSKGGARFADSACVLEREPMRPSDGVT